MEDMDVEILAKEMEDDQRKFNNELRGVLASIPN
jgi:predicted outer membrane protein